MKYAVKNKRWTKEDEKYVRQNLGKVSFEAMAKHLCRSPMAIRLYVHRKRMTVGRTVKRNLMLEMLRIKFRHPEDFYPSRTFYQETGISQRRYWDLYSGRKPITIKEYTSVAEYFGITMREAFNSRQLELFEEK